MKKLIAVVTLFALLTTTLFSGALAEAPQTRDSAYFTSYGTSMSAIGDGKIHITFKAVGTNICNQIGVASYTVQRLDDDGSWDDVSGLLSGQTGTNVTSYTYARIFQGVEGETYRVQVTFMCVIGTSAETKSYTSGNITAD